MKWSLACAVIVSAALSAQNRSDALQPVATTKELMLDMIVPAANGLLLAIHRNSLGDENAWAEARRNAMMLAESGNLLIMRNGAASWVADAKLLVEVGAAAYRATQAKDTKALESLADRIDGSCTTCHRHFRPTVFAPNDRR